MRWEAMMAKLRSGTIQEWFADFLDALQEQSGSAEPAATKPAPVWPLRSVGASGARLH